MAGITQTVSNYVGGISQQSDDKKNPGMVKSLVNAIPHLSKGLYKRPGTKRVGTDKLASGGTAIPAGGSWFHYYRDESEGAYIGQIATDGKIRMWKCSDGSEKNVWYHTDNSAYNGSNSDHTSITNYLSASNTEDVQALTINDTTYLNNRDTVVATTGTTDARPHTHWAYIELKKAENGRQYGLNIYDNETTSTIKTATRLKVASDTLYEASHSGHCPGIGTQVFSGAETNTGSRKNLTFRITTIGQQGQVPQTNTDDDPGADNWQCSYSRRVELLHGGEDWEDGDTTTVTLNNAPGASSNNGGAWSDATYTVEVTEHVATTCKANIKAVRPAPTPFDQSTCVTADTILGGIIGELPGGFTYNTIGNGIYLTRSTAFNVEATDLDLMNVISSEINDVTKLPNQCRNDVIVKIANTRMSNEDDYYMKFKGENGLDGKGAWVECAEPGIVKSFDATTMPHILQRQADGDFLVKKNTWKDRVVGDDYTNPIPTFAKNNNKINRVLFWQNRLIFLSAESVICSKPSDFTNFWSQTALTISNIDPIDITSSSTFPSDLFDGIVTTTGLVVFSTNQQFLLASDDAILNNDTAKLRSISMLNYNHHVPPFSLGLTTGYLDNSGKYSRFMEMANVQREGEPIVFDQSTVVPTLLDKNIDLIANSRENGLLLFGKTNTDTVIGYKYLIIGQKRMQSAWFKLKFNNPIRYHFIVNDTYYMLDMDGFLQTLNIVQSDTDPSIDQDNVNYLLHLDNYTTISGGSYSDTTQLTTFSSVSWMPNVTSPNGKLVLVDSDSNTAREGRYAETTATSTTSFTVPGDWSSATLNIGYLYDYQIDFPRMYVTKSSGEKTVADVNASLIIHRVNINFGKIGLYETTLTRLGKDPYTEVYESTDLDEYNASDAPYLEEIQKTIPVYEKNLNVDLTLKSTHPAPATLHSMSWEGDYSPMFYRRV